MKGTKLPGLEQREVSWMVGVMEEEIYVFQSILWKSKRCFVKKNTQNYKTEMLATELYRPVYVRKSFPYK